MLANFFEKSNPVSLLVIVVLFWGLFLSHLFYGSSLKELTVIDLMFYGQIIFLFALLFFFYIFILSKNKLTLDDSYGFLFFVLLFGFFPNVLINFQAVLVTLLSLFYIRKILSLRLKKSIISKLYDSGFWLGIIFLIDSFSILFYGLLLAGTAMFQQLNLRTFLVSIIGIITPVFLYFTYCFWYEKLDNFYTLFYLYTDFDFSFYREPSSVFPLVFILIISFLTIIIKTPQILFIRGEFRKFWNFSILYFLLGLFYVCITPNRDGSELVAIFFPSSILFANLIEEIKKPIFKNLLLLLFLVIPIIVLIV